MHRDGSDLVFSPTDLCRFVESRFSSWMDRRALERPDESARDPVGEDLELVRRKGREHEDAYVASLTGDEADPFDPSDAGRSFAARREATVEAMRRGEPSIQQAALGSGALRGYADLLVRREGASDLGEYHYVPREVKLGASVKPAYVLQLCAYADLLEAEQGLRPPELELVLRGFAFEVVPTVEPFHYYLEQKRTFLAFHAAFDPDARPVPGMGEDHGAWTGEARRYLESIDHLSLVAQIRRSQIERLEAAGITTMAALAESTLERVPRLNRSVLDRLRRQARLQVQSAGCDRPAYEVLPSDPDRPARGLALLPPSSSNDVFFDMEGYPLREGGLEYLFGASVRNGERLEFVDWWAHSRDEEGDAFAAFLDWVHERWIADPSMHVYHYAPYETTALKRLASVHGSREAMLDQLLRNEVFIDLYAIVRHGVLVGEPRYSIKNLERLFRDGREGEVTSAVGSIVEYQRFLDSGEPADWQRSPILEGIRDYNRDDCESTVQLADWLRGRQREHDIAYRGKEPTQNPVDPEQEMGQAAARRHALALRLLELPDPIGRLLGHLVEFHRREDKPKWWDLFRRHEMTDDELFEDLACLGELRILRGSERRVGRSLALRYRFDPDQDTRLSEGRKCLLSHDLEVRAEILELNGEAGEIELLFGPRVVDSEAWPPPSRISLLPDEFIPSEPLQQAVEQAANRWLDSGQLSPAMTGFLQRDPPRLADRATGPIIDEDEAPSDGCVRVVPTMLDTALSIQGPPGSGKTYTAARTILELLRRGKRIGVTSNSHKAILNLLVKCTELGGPTVQCLKAGGAADDPLLLSARGIRHVGGGRAAAAVSRDFALVGGTAWLFCRPDMARSVDYLFVDEAGQVSVANLLAMSAAARNLVLVGDQMQLGQPTQALHPEESGASILEYLLRDERTIPADRGVFLDVTYRLHPAICRLNSEAFYEGKLHSAPGCEKRVIRVPPGNSGRLERGSGVVFLPVEHEGNTQGSDEEAEVVRELFDELLGLETTDMGGNVAGRLDVDDILVVAPYNMQVRKLRDLLPTGARVGSVDKFQGQEAPVVILTLCTSEVHDSPRGIEFLLNPNRLNVALSRARSLAIVVGHPGIARTRCRTLEQMKLVNLFCRIADEGSSP